MRIVLVLSLKDLCPRSNNCLVRNSGAVLGNLTRIHVLEDVKYRHWHPPASHSDLLRVAVTKVLAVGLGRGVIAWISTELQPQQICGRRLKKEAVLKKWLPRLHPKHLRVNTVWLCHVFASKH